MAKVLMVHGYLLSGTGSNLYVRNVVKSMCEAGQDVDLVCQEFTPQDYDFIAKCYKAQDDQYHVAFERETPYPGTCEIYIPDIENELLVYVHDRYHDLHVQEMRNATEEEIQAYIERNARTIRHICENHDIAQIYSNHLVLQPQYVAKGIEDAGATIPHIIIAHGSDLVYAVSQSAFLDRLSRTTLSSCAELVAVSQDSKQAMQNYYHDMDLSGCKVIPAGLDEQLYVDMSPDEERSLLEEYIDAVDQGNGFSTKQSQMIEKMIEQDSYDFEMVQESYEAKDIEVDIKDKLFDMLYRRDTKKVIYLGKYLEQKGLIPLVLGLPLLYAKDPLINVILVGFGALRAQLEYIIQLIKLGKVDVVFDQASQLGVALEQDRRSLDELQHLLSNAQDLALYKKGTDLMDENTLFTGFLDQKYAVRILCHGTVGIFPSLTREAFGMVGIEAMASKTKPLCTRHSGLKETLKVAAEHIPGLDINDYSVPLDEHLIINIVDKTGLLLDEENDGLVQEMSTFALGNYGWKGITQELMAL